MLKRIWNNKLRFVGGVVVVVCFALIRVFENTLFYDPFIHFFTIEFTDLPLPAFDWLQLSLSLFFRYGLNSFLSLVLLYLIFKDRAMLHFVVFLFLLFFIILMVSLFAVIHFYEAQNPMFIFYIRRFLIQPIFVILFIPAFWFQKLKDNLG